MMASLKSEFRKIYTVRTTYLILLASVIIIAIFSFYVEGIKAGSTGAAVTDPYKLSKLVRDAVANMAGLGAIIGILSFTHEYRFNTITYTLTASRSRGKTLLAKLAAISAFSVLFTIFVALSAVGLMYLGLAIKGLGLTHQIFPTNLIWRVFFVGWGFAMIASLLAVLIRHQIGAVVTYFIIPGPVESLLGIPLKDHRIYLPFTSLQQVTGAENLRVPHALSHGRSAMVFTIYLLVGWAVAWILFLRRDAT
jgi:ABC-2 type transport system permease protein